MFSNKTIQNQENEPNSFRILKKLWYFNIRIQKEIFLLGITIDIKGKKLNITIYF